MLAPKAPGCRACGEQAGKTFVGAVLIHGRTRVAQSGGKGAVNLAIAAAVFPVIFLGELPDKTMFASLVLATRGRARAVWLGAALAFVVHVVIATTVGVVLFRLVPRRAVEAVVAGIFLLGAALAFVQAKGAGRVADLGDRAPVDSALRVALTAFVTIFLAEWGDLTQILTADLAAHYHAPLSVGVGALLALWVVAGIAVIGGRGMPRFLPAATIRKATVPVLLILAALAAWSAAR